MTDLETKIWDMVSNWAKEQIYPINDFALRALMDEILALVNESSKEAEIKKLVEELKEDKIKLQKKQYNETDSGSKKYCILFGQRYSTGIFITKLENILNGMDKRK